MTTPATTTPNTPAPVEKEKGAAFEKFIGTLPPALQAHIKMQELLGRAHATVLAQTAWGNAAPPEVRAAVGRYLAKHNLDPSHIDVLGGNLYRNHRYYLDQLAPMRQKGLVLYAIYDHIEVDPRLDRMVEDKSDADLAEWARKERGRRAKERIIHGVLDDALSAVVFRLKLKTTDGGETDEITGAKAVYRSDKDPIGGKNPVTTAESRAARRCLRNAIPSLPAEQKQRLEVMDADFEVLKTETAGKLPTGDEEDPDRPKAVEVNGVKFRPAGPQVHALAGGADPYAESLKGSDASALDRAKALKIPGDQTKWGGFGGSVFGAAPPKVLKAIVEYCDGLIAKAGTEGTELERDHELHVWKDAATLILESQPPREPGEDEDEDRPF